MRYGKMKSKTFYKIRIMKIKLLLFVLLLSFFSLIVNAQTVEIDGVYYEIIPKGKVANVTSHPNGPKGYEGSIIIPDCIEYEGDTYDVISVGTSFAGSKITEITIGNKVTEIEKGAFSSCEKLTSVSMGDGIKKIGDSAFINCRILSSVSLGQNVEEIGAQAFCGWYLMHLIGNYLNQIEIPNSVVSIGDEAFHGCKYLSSVTFGNGVTSIGEFAFNGTALMSVDLPNSVTNIGGHAFQGCNKLETIKLPDNITSIEERTFAGCSGLKTITIPDNVETIGIGAFEDCRSASSLVLGKNLKRVKVSAFSGCTRLSEIHIPDLPSWLNLELESNPLYFAHHLFVNGKEITDLFIENIPFVCNFAGCEGLKSVTIGEGVNYIDKKSFDGCKNLTTFIMKKGELKYIGDDAFSGCDNLTYVNIADLEAWCNIQFGDKYTSNSNGVSYSNPLAIAHHLFLNEEEITDLVIPNSIKSIGDWIFCGCSSLNSVDIPNSVTSINKGSFSQCSGLTTITIPNSVTDIGSKTFIGCGGLTTVIIGNKVTSIANRAFMDCKDLTDVYCYEVDVPNTDTNAFENSFIEYATLHVPQNSIEKYKASAPWKNFKDIVEIENEVIDGDVTGDGRVDVADIVELVNYIMGNLSDISDAKITDVNGDGMVNAADVVQIVNIIMGK